MIKELDIDIYSKTLTKKIKSWTIINMFCVDIPLLFPPEDEELDLPPLYRIPKLHMSLHKQCFIAESAQRNLFPINIYTINDQKQISE